MAEPNAYDNYIAMLQNQLTQQDTLEQERLALSQKQRDTLNRPVRYGFMNEGQTSLEAFKNPDAAQSRAIFDFGTTLLASDPNKALSQRIGSALGAGVEGMDKVRNKEMARDMAFSKLNLENLAAKRDLISGKSKISQSIFTAGQQEESMELRRKADTRAGKSEERASWLNSIQRQKNTLENQRDGLTIEQSNKNANIFSAREGLLSFYDEGGTLEDIKNAQISRSLAEQNGITLDAQGQPENEADRAQFEDLLTQFLGAKTIPNAAYNPALTKLVQEAGNSLYFSDGSKDGEAAKWKAMGIGGATAQPAKESVTMEAFIKSPDYNNFYAQAEQLMQDQINAMPAGEEREAKIAEFTALSAEEKKKTTDKIALKLSKR